MALQFSVAGRNARANAIETTIGTSAIVRIRTGAPPATCATADSGTVLATMNLPVDYFAPASAGSMARLGTWSDTAADAAGTAAHFRMYESGGTVCGMQGTCGQSVIIATSALTAANGNVLTFAATTGVVVGMNVSGTGVLADATVVAVTGTTATLSHTTTAGVASAASITFAYDLPIDNAVIALNQVVTINTFTINEANA